VKATQKGNKQLDVLGELTGTILAIKEHISKAQVDLDNELAKAMAIMEALEITVNFSEAGTITLVEPTRLTIDEQALRDELIEMADGELKFWNRVSTRTLDKKKLEDAISRKFITAELVAKHSENVPTKPYLRVSKGTTPEPTLKQVVEEAREPGKRRVQRRG
jgi:hypothetical protein